MKYILKTMKDGTEVTVKDVQNILLDMIKDIDELCKKNNIEYVLTGGSTLGAIRHKGFIPWDDDMDIAMKRSEYHKFIKALKKDLNKEKYTFHCYEVNKKYNVVAGPAMKIRKKGTYLKESNVLLPNQCKDSDGIFIDVFIYDHMAKSTIFDIPLRAINTLLMPIAVFFENIHINPIPIKALFRFNAVLYGKLCSKSKYMGDELTWVYSKITHPLRYLETDLFPVQYVPFENIELPVQHDYDAYLKKHYGPNYMTPPPKKKQFAKHIVDINLNGDQPE